MGEIPRQGHMGSQQTDDFSPLGTAPHYQQVQLVAAFDKPSHHLSRNQYPLDLI
jgi:hypothetical protein